MKHLLFTLSLLVIFLLAEIVNARTPIEIFLDDYSPYAKRIIPVTGTPIACSENQVFWDMTNHRLLGCETNNVVKQIPLITIGSALTTTPGGSDTQVQFNDSGVFAGNAGFTFNKTNLDLTIGRDVLATRQLSGQFATLTPLSDISTIYARRFSSTQTSPILLFQTEGNVSLTFFDKSGIFNGNVIGNITGNLTGTASGNEVPLTFSTGVTRTTNNITVDAVQTITRLANLTTNGFIKTSSLNGTLLVDTATYLNAANNLSDLASAITARTNLGLGTAATSNTSAFEVPLTFSSPLVRTTNTITCPNCAVTNTTNTFTGNQTFVNNILASSDGTPNIGAASSGRFNINAFGLGVNLSRMPTGGMFEAGSGASIVQIGNGSTVGVRLGASIGINFASNPEAVAPDIGLWRNSAGVFEINNASGSLGTYRDLKLRQLFADSTYTATGTTGAQTINKQVFSVNLAASATSLVVTNSLVAATSGIICTVNTNDATTKSAAAVPASGSLTIFPNVAPTAETRITCEIFN